MNEIDYAGAVQSYTPWIMAILQVVKQSPKVKNEQLPYYALVLGLILGLVNAVQTGVLGILESGLIGDTGGTLLSLLEGTFAGAVGPVAYTAQKRWLGGVLPAGPDNYEESGGGARG